MCKKVPEEGRDFWNNISDGQYCSDAKVGKPFF